MLERYRQGGKVPGQRTDKDNQRADWDAWLVLARKLRPDPDDGEGRDGVPGRKRRKASDLRGWRQCSCDYQLFVLRP